MAVWTPDSALVKGAKAEFFQKLDTVPTVYQNHCQIVKSTAASEQYVWAGQAPIPRLFLNERTIQGIRDFTYDKKNNTYELTTFIARDWWEDDQTGMIASRMREWAEVWATFKDYLFGALVAAGQSSAAHPWANYDGSTNKYFFDDDHSWGSTGTIDNKRTSVATADNAVPTAAEMLLAIGDAKAAMLGFKDDQGRPFNTLAASKLQLLVAPLLEGPALEAMNATFTVGPTEYGSRENVRRGMAEEDVTPYLSDGTTTQDFYISATGAERKPYIYQERTPLEVIMLADAENIAKHNGVLVLTRQRFVMFLGELRRAVWHRFTT